MEESKETEENKKKEEAKKKKRTVKVVVSVLITLVIGALVFFFGRNSANNDQLPSIDIDFQEADDNINSDIVTDVLPEDIITTLEEVLALDDESHQTRKPSNRSEVTYATDENGNLVNLRDAILETSNLDDGILLNTISRNDAGEADTTKRNRRAANRTSTDTNDSLESTLNNFDEIKDTILPNTNISDITEKFVGKVSFNYGSFLDMSNMAVEVEKYLLVQKLEVEKKEYASIILGLNDLISHIPEDKKSSAVFLVAGYADTTLFNGVPEVSERSEKFNKELSEKRAESVKSILTGKDFGISPDKVVTYGFGYSKNVNETTNLERFRRVDIGISFN